MVFLFAKPASIITPSGLPASYASTFFFKSDYFRNLPSYWYNSYTSSDQIIFCSDNKQSLYCHLLCGLVKRDEVIRVGAAFASVLVQAIIYLEKSWKEICSNIRSGKLSEWITDLRCRDYVSTILEGPNPQLADLIEHECIQKSWEGIIRRLWPKTKFIESIVTGQMAQQIPALEFYSNNLPLISTTYGASETMIGINLNPLCKPQDVSYTFVPTMSYFEFLHVDDEGNDEIVDLVNVKIGGYYEVLVTNYSGLHRFKIGDILQVTGFYNSAPQFRFVRRKNVSLSVHLEDTTEEEILKAVTHATTLLKFTDLKLRDFTCYPEISTSPGHFIIYWELQGNNNNNDIVEELDTNLLVECCSLVDVSLNASYRSYRKDGSIGALEIRVVQQGTFDSLMEYFISQGASISQYKIPRCIKSSEALEVLENGVIARFFSKKSPPVDSSPC